MALGSREFACLSNSREGVLAGTRKGAGGCFTKSDGSIAGACNLWEGREFLKEATAMYASMTYTELLGARGCPTAQHNSLQDTCHVAGVKPDCNPCVACIQAVPMPSPSCLWALPFVPVPVYPLFQ